MMSLQALKDDLANEGERGGCMDCNVHCKAHQVAERLAALYDFCAWCGGTGFVNPQGRAFGDGPCDNCDGTGATLAADDAEVAAGRHPLWGLEDGIGAVIITASDLARYLFGKEG
jgi:hypothetical protein